MPSPDNGTYLQRPGVFICRVPDLNDPKAPGVRSYGSDPAYIARLIEIWSGFETRWVDVGKPVEYEPSVSFT